jgi:hypothetical protein
MSEIAYTNDICGAKLIVEAAFVEKKNEKRILKNLRVESKIRQYNEKNLDRL